ncbi:MAG: DUF2848 family protein [Halodesulfurarchaeum sp.]
MYEFVHDGRCLDVELDRVYNAGYSGRDQEAVQDHIDELVEEGIPEPEHVPEVYEMAPYTTQVDPETVRVVGPDTSGEAEFALVFAGEETYVTAASDHTDRDLETQSIQKSKQIAPNVLSRDVWRLEAVRDHFDEIELRAWNWIDGERTRYQDTTLSAILPPEDIVETVREQYGEPLRGAALLSGTVATVTGDIKPGTRFVVELVDPVRDRSISVGYDVESM